MEKSKAAGRSRSAKGKTVFPIVDGHAHLGPREIGEEYESMTEVYSAKEMIRSLDANRIDIAVVFAMRQADDYGKANRYIAEAARSNPKRLVAFARLNPWLEKSPEMLQQAVRQEDVKGLKLHPADECFDADDAIVHPLLELADKHRLPVIFHTGATARPALIGMAADRFPHVNMLLAHLGTNLYQDCIFVAKKCENVYLETSQCPFLPRIARMVVLKVGAHRVIWGSDIPYHFQEIERRKIELARLKEEELRLVMGGNVLRLLSYSASKA